MGTASLSARAGRRDSPANSRSSRPDRRATSTPTSCGARATPPGGRRRARAHLPAPQVPRRLPPQSAGRTVELRRSRGGGRAGAGAPRGCSPAHRDRRRRVREDPPGAGGRVAGDSTGSRTACSSSTSRSSPIRAACGTPVGRHHPRRPRQLRAPARRVGRRRRCAARRVRVDRSLVDEPRAG